MTAGPGLFISHAVADTPVVNLFVDLIESGIGVPPDEIFCTSRKGQGVRPGSEFKKSIGDHLSGATTVIALISEHYYNSPFCMCELGGTWLQAKDFIPILVPPARYAHMKAVLNGLQALKLESSEDLDELRDTLADRLGFKALPTPRWNERSATFVESLPERLKLLPRSASVPRGDLEKQQKVAEEYRKELENARNDYRALQSSFDELKKVKDVAAVAEIQLRHMPSADAFQALVNAARKALEGVSGVVREAAYAHQCRDYYYPGSPSSKYTWDDVTRPAEYKELLVMDGEKAAHLNGKNPKVGRVISSLRDLDRWLTSEAPEAFYSSYASSHDGYHPDLSDRGFWDRHLW